jgi:hypothetical protein
LRTHPALGKTISELGRQNGKTAISKKKKKSVFANAIYSSKP